MNKNIIILPNLDLIKEVKEKLNYVPVNLNDMISYHNELCKLQNKLFNYKEPFFKEAEEFILKDEWAGNTATVVLDSGIEDAINAIFEKQKSIFHIYNQSRITIKNR